MDSIDKNQENDFLNMYNHAGDSEKRKYDKSDFAAAVMILFMGYLFVKFVMLGGYGIGVTVFNLILIIMSAVYYKSKNIKFSTASKFYMILTLIFAIQPILYSSEFIARISSLMTFILYIYSFFVAGGNRQEKYLGDMAFADMVKASAVMPFGDFGSICGALRSGSNGNRGIFKKIKYIVLGLIISAVPTIVITLLLMHGDSNFGNLIISIFFGNNFFVNVFKEFRYFLLGIPAALYIFGFLYSASEKHFSQYMTAEKNTSALYKISFCPTAVVYSAATPVMLVYIIYFFSQIKYYMSAFSGVLPEAYTYSDYARKGFFELCAVSCINAVIILSICIFTKRNNDGKHTKIQRAYVIILSVFTLVLISTAMSKMIMYISNNGLTRLRVYTSWFMILLGLMFVFVIIRQIDIKFNLSASAAILCVIMAGLLSFSNVDGMIAKHNIVDLYLNGTFDRVDIFAMYDLSDAAVPYVAQLIDDDNPDMRAEAREYLREMNRKKNDSTWYTFNLSSLNSNRILNGINFKNLN